MSAPQQLSLQDAWQHAVSSHQSGQLQQAEQWYRAILQAVPQHADANHNLGLLLASAGHTSAGLGFLKAALDIAPDNPRFILSYSNALREESPDAAQALLHNTVASGIETEEIWCNLGNMLHAKGKLDEAAQAQEKSLAIAPDYAIAHFNLALVRQDAGDFKAAAQSYRQTIRLQGEFAEAHNNLGLVLRELGELEAARQEFGIALGIRPHYADAAYNLGQAQLALGKADAAQAAFASAISAAPAYAEAHHALATLLLEDSKHAQAIAHFQAALANKPDLALARLNLANALLESGALNEALVHARAAVAQCPTLAAGHHNLGTILRRLNRFDEAEASYRHALAIDADFPDALLGLAAVLRYNEHEDAERACRRALQLQPDNAQGHVLLADLLSSAGRFFEAESELGKAIEISPDMPEAWAALPGLRKMTVDDAAWLQQARRIAGSGLNAEKEAYLRFAMGKYHDDTRDYEQAFREYRQANELSKRHTGPYDRAAEERRIDITRKSYTHEWVCRPRREATQSARPIFIIGMPRSGTSLAEQILAAHPAVFGAGELSYWKNVAADFSPFVVQEGSPRLPGTPTLKELGESYLDLLRRHDGHAARVVDKMPANFECLGLIHAALPHARIVHMQRNPSDTCLSIYFQHFESYHRYANDLENLAHYYQCYRKLMQHWESALPEGSIFTLPYEALVQDQEQWTRRLLEFCGLEWDARCLDFQQSERRVGTASNWQVRQKIGGGSIERWRHYAKHLEPLTAALGENA